MGSVDHGFTDDRSGQNEKDFTYMLLGASSFVSASAIRLGVVHFVATMSASADVLALASAEFDISEIDDGQGITVKWRGKPVFIRKRLPEEIAAVEEVDAATLRDPEPDAVRVVDGRSDVQLSDSAQP